jgi:hypothetical protein
MIYTDDEVAEHDAARDQQQKAAAAPGEALAAAKGAQILSATPTGPGSALSAMLGGGQGQPAQPGGAA